VAGAKNGAPDGKQRNAGAGGDGTLAAVSVNAQGMVEKLASEAEAAVLFSNIMVLPQVSCCR
jgi:hypothetical protein